MMSERLNDVHDDTEKPQASDECMDSPGVFLSARRQELGWSIEQIADQIKLAPRQVLAIEADDYAALPPMAVTRGFIRSYAKCLRVDATPLLVKLNTEVISNLNMSSLRRTIPVNFSEGRFPSMGSRSSVFSRWNFGVVFLIVLLLSALLAQRMGWLPDLSKITIASSINRNQSVQVDALPTLDKDAITLQSKVNKADAVNTSVLAQVPVLASKDADAFKDAVVATSIAPDAAAEKNQLVLRAREDSWIEIKRANKSIGFSRILKAGEVEKFEITEPVLLIIGNVAGVDVTLRGESLNTKAGINGNVARINLK